MMDGGVLKRDFGPSIQDVQLTDSGACTVINFSFASNKSTHNVVFNPKNYPSVYSHNVHHSMEPADDNFCCCTLISSVSSGAQKESVKGFIFSYTLYLLVLTIVHLITKVLCKLCWIFGWILHFLPNYRIVHFFLLNAVVTDEIARQKDLWKGKQTEIEVKFKQLYKPAPKQRGKPKPPNKELSAYAANLTKEFFTKVSTFKLDIINFINITTSQPL